MLATPSDSEALFSHLTACADPEYLVRYYRGERDPARTPHASRAEAGVPHEDVPARPTQEVAQVVATGQPDPASAASSIDTLEALASTDEVSFSLLCSPSIPALPLLTKAWR